MVDRKTVIVVLSRNHSVGLGVVRSLGEAGYTVDLLSSTHRTGASDIVSNSKYVRHHREVVSRKRLNYENHELIEALTNHAEEHGEDQLVLLPTDAYTLAVVDMHREMLKENYVIPGVEGFNDGQILEYLDYGFQKNLAKEAGFDQKQEWIVDLKDIHTPEGLEFPCICRPCDLVTSSNKDIVELEDEITMKIHLNTMRRKNDERSVVLSNAEEFSKIVEINGVSFNGEVHIPAVIDYTEYAQYNKAIPFAGRVAAVSEYEDICSKVTEIIKKLNYTGMFSVEIDIEGDKIYMNEIGLYAGKACYIYSEAGANLPVAYVERVIGKADATSLTAEAGKTFIFDNIIRKDFKRELIDEEEMNALIEKNEITVIKNENDDMPEEIMLNTRRAQKTGKKKKKRSLKARIKRFIKKKIFPLIRPFKYKLWQYPQADPNNARNPESERPRVIVSGRNYGSNLCIARGIGKAGYEVEILRIFHRKPKRRQLMKKMVPDAYSKYIKAFRVCVYGGKSKRVVNRLIKMADPDRKMLIVPADDLVACIIDDYYDELSQYFVLPNVNNKSGMINHLMSKGVQKELAIKAGLPVVNSCIIQTVNGEFEIPETVTYPCFTKPNISKNGSKTKMKKCDSEAELREHLTAISEKKDVEMLVEDYVEIGREYSILGVSTKNGAIGPGFFGAEEGGQVEHRGVAVTGQVLPVSLWQDLIDDTVKFVGSLGFDGLYDVDFIETVDGKVYFVEVNMRFGGSGYAITESGVNLPGMFADYMLLGKPIDMNVKLENTGKRFVSEKVLIEEYLKNRISMARVNEIMDDVDIHFIKNDEDPKAYEHFKKYYKIAAVLRLIYRIKDGTDNEFGK